MSGLRKKGRNQCKRDLAVPTQMRHPDASSSCWQPARSRQRSPVRWPRMLRLRRSSSHLQLKRSHHSRYRYPKRPLTTSGIVSIPPGGPSGRQSATGRRACPGRRPSTHRLLAGLVRLAALRGARKLVPAIPHTARRGWYPLHPCAVLASQRLADRLDPRMARIVRRVLGGHRPAQRSNAFWGRAEDAFHVVVPSLPGFGFSDKPTETGWDVTRIARAWATLMPRLGYQRWVAQGGDWGAGVTTPRPSPAAGLIAAHVNWHFVFPENCRRSPRRLSRSHRRGIGFSER